MIFLLLKKYLLDLYVCELQEIPHERINRDENKFCEAEISHRNAANDLKIDE